MTALWAAFLELSQLFLFRLTQFHGGRLTAGILSFSPLARLAPVPITVGRSMAALGVGAGASESQPAWTLAIPVPSNGVTAPVFSAGFGLHLPAGRAVRAPQRILVRRIETQAGRGR